MALAGKISAEHGAPVCGLGIGAPGVVDGEKGVVRSSGNLGWENKPLAEDLSAMLGIPVTLANDANAAAYGEYVCGAGKQYNSVVLITLGTGVGSGIVLNGKLYEGNEGAGVELGHEVIRFGGEKCACGRRGRFEAYASATALIRQTKRAMEKDRQSTLWLLCNGDAKLATAYAYAKVALDVSAQNRENGKKGGLIMAERMRGMKQMPKRLPVSDSPMDMLLKAIVMSVADDAGKHKAAK